jgi:hypothetical protein
MILSLLMEDKEIAFSKVRRGGRAGGREGRRKGVGGRKHMHLAYRISEML